MSKKTQKKKKTQENPAKETESSRTKPLVVRPDAVTEESSVGSSFWSEGKRLCRNCAHINGDHWCMLNPGRVRVNPTDWCSHFKSKHFAEAEIIIGQSVIYVFPGSMSACTGLVEDIANDIDSGTIYFVRLHENSIVVNARRENILAVGDKIRGKVN